MGAIEVRTVLGVAEMTATLKDEALKTSSRTYKIVLLHVSSAVIGLFLTRH